MQIVKILAILFTLSLPFFDVPRLPISGLSITFYVSFPFIFFYFLICKKIVSKNFTVAVALFLIFWFFYVSSAFINFQQDSGKAFNHVFYYFITFYVYYFCCYFVIKAIGLECFKRYVIYGLYLVFIIGITELALFYFKGYAAYASFLNHGQNVGTSMGLPRMRSTFNEPSHLAIYLLAILPLVYSNKKALTIWFFAFITTFSSSAFMGLAGALLMLALLKPFVIPSYRSIISSTFILLLSILLFVVLYDTSIVQKVINVNDFDSVRSSAVNISMNFIDNSILLGNGPAFYYNYFTYGLFNLYLQLYIEVGLIGLFLYFAFYFFHVFRVGFENVILLFSMISILFLYIAMDHYYIPGLWLLLSFSLFLHQGNVNESKTYNNRIE
ncbi:O-Antigen ligase family protein [Vibrio cholerae HC-46B1]|uniref:hypothetical protein n=1 Tax=Vibrio cholerae TaxID=666 RepID=UPI0002734A1B|nr:hypothetical protein [Vibrio cholerae]EJH57683.1 putative membrane protein [Vibrio cholerae HC-43B1]EKL04675.1 O-Antigen ligase family protein [Vibrio cholerae HC-41B1]EKL99004.1 O-Antigen ligase family protein [Vibrio cholerae HC-46B1]EKM07058.1 O-Antigen ligase family protein [Vibrio cholerae HC-44C1]